MTILRFVPLVVAVVVALLSVVVPVSVIVALAGVSPLSSGSVHCSGAGVGTMCVAAPGGNT